MEVELIKKDFFVPYFEWILVKNVRSFISVFI
jgi:hypothetical protein